VQRFRHHDYASKQWGGLAKNFHAKRYELFVKQALAAFEGGPNCSATSGSFDQVCAPPPPPSSNYNPPTSPRPSLFFFSFLQALYDQLSLNMTIDWTNQLWDPSVFPAEPVGDPVTVSTKLLQKYPLSLGNFKCPSV
jgi:hypothetical protein